MTSTIAFFEYSTEEDFSYVLEFVAGLTLTGRLFEVKIKDRASNTTRATLTLGNGLTLVNPTQISAAFAKVDMVATWPTGEYSADLVDITDGGHGRIMAVRFTYDQPGRLVYGVRDRKAFINWSPNKAYVTATGAIGPAGPRGAQGDPGADGADGADGSNGADGNDGWTPELAAVTDGLREVHQVVDWFGGEGTKPATELYVGAAGLVADIADAKNIRGAQGPSGSVTDGDKGDILVSGSGTAWSLDRAAVSGDEPDDMVRLGDDGSGGGKLPAVDGSDLTGLTLGQLDDVDLTTDAPSTGDALIFDGTDWVPAPPSATGAVLYNGAQALTDPQKAQGRDNIAAMAVLIGAHLRGSFTALPARCVWANGQNLSRTTYALLLAATTIAGTVSISNASASAQITVGDAEAGSMLRPGLSIEATGIPAGATITAATLASGTTYNITLSAAATATAGANAARLFPNGAGDGSTTFGVADLRDRAGVGRGNMGGTAAARLTSAIAGFDSNRLGATGGDQRLHAHNHSLGIPTAGHVLVLNGSGVYVAQTDGLTYSSGTGTTGAGVSQNVQPSIVENVAIYAGV